MSGQRIQQAVRLLQQALLARHGRRMALGVLVCNQCGHRHLVLHPERIVSCIECGGEEFSREALTP